MEPKCQETAVEILFPFHRKTNRGENTYHAVGEVEVTCDAPGG